MKTAQPIQRHRALQPLSREHHHALLLCWKIRAGLRKAVEAERIKKYCDCVFKNQLLPHFDIEEKHVFPLLGKKHDFAVQGFAQHRELKQLFKRTTSVEILHKIADLLNEHVRFEERVLFNEIQKAATAEELKKIAELHPEQAPVCKAVDEWEDEFWLIRQ